MPAGSRMITSK